MATLHHKPQLNQINQNRHSFQKNNVLLDIQNSNAVPALHNKHNQNPKTQFNILTVITKFYKYSKKIT